MNTNLTFVKDLRKLFVGGKQQVSKVQMTSGNYNDDGSEIQSKIPTITTDFCEIGVYTDICYFAILLKPELFTEELFDAVSAYLDVQIYGLRNFTDNYYPKDDFDYEEFEEQIVSEKYMQIQFNFSTNRLNSEAIKDKYFEVKSIFEKAKIAVENQLVDNFKDN